jgi:hypothetical protein
MKSPKAIGAATRVAGVLLAFGLWAAATAEAQTADPRVADLVRPASCMSGCFFHNTAGVRTA